MARRTLLLVRHGMTVMNQKELFQGKLDSQLSELGVRESIALGKYLQKNHWPLDQVYCSPYGRAQKTCELILSQFESHPQIQYDDNLVELDFGVFEGQKYSQCEQGYPKTYHQLYEDPRNYQPLNGESLSNILGRVFIFLQDILEKKWDTALVVTHGVVVRCFLHILFNRGIDEFWIDDDIGASSVTELLISDGSRPYELVKFSYKE